ncbi:hypothetical protein G4O51_03835 [Candidatus Bathyarchaeota archaeon A05DMB-2]|nr:hypothetical protein [Candidatus Bathyarchaeota archaeon A05DMB-2]
MNAAELKAAAEAYHNIGFNVFTIKGKQPLAKWEKWQSERQTQQEFNSLNFNDADGLGVICGTKNNDGLYLAVVDFDLKNLSPEAVEKGNQVLKELPITAIEETPSKGQHWIYYTHQKPRTVKTFHNEAAVELLGEHCYCAMAPSQGYKRLNDNTPTVVQDLEDLLYDALYKVGIKAEEKNATWFDRKETAAFKGEHPPCIRELLKGVNEGLRNEVAIRLSAYFVNFRQLEPKKAKVQLEFWNKLNNPKLPTQELNDIFSSAIKGKYVFGCADPILKKHCNENVFCALRKTENQTQEKPVFDDATEAALNAELQKILDAENQLEALSPHLDNILTGEENTKKAVVVLNLSGKCKQAEMKQIILFKATEGAGKSTLMRVLTRGYKVKDVGRFSEHALDYTNLEGFEILSLKELGAMDQETQGVSTVKFLSSDDQGYVVEVTVKNEKGGFTTEQHKIPAITTISSTTRLLLDPQFERRAWLFGLDETPEQTRKIAQWLAKQEKQKAEKALGLRTLTDEEFSSEVYSRFIEQFEPKNILILFPQTLLNTLGFEVLRVRGDMAKLLTFVKLYAMLNVKRLEKLNNDVYALTPTVAIEALKIALSPLSAMLSKVDSRTKAVFNALKEIVEIKEKYVDKEPIEEEIAYSVKGSEITKKIREKIAVKIGKSERTIRAFFSQLEASGYVSSDQKKPKTYTLLYDVEEIERKTSGILDKIKSADNLIAEMVKEAQEWRKHGLEISFLGNEKKLPTPEPVEGVEGEKFFTVPENKISNPNLSDSGFSFGERQVENRQIQKLPKDFSLFYCKLCEKANRTMVFATKTDLEIHLTNYHNHPEHGDDA